jgi:hypothetical protein
LRYSFRFGENTKFGKLYPNTYQGIGVAYNSFFYSKYIGNPVAVYAFQGAPIAHLSNRLSLDYEWDFGASFGWRPYDKETNSYNLVVGSKINAYINLGFMMNWRLTDRLRMTAGVEFTHFSNGNTHYPNAGVNTIGGKVGIVSTFGDNSYKSSHSENINPYVSYDIIIYGAPKKKGYITDEEATMIPGRFGVAGININPLYNVNKFFRTGLSIDAQYDESANIESYHVDGTYGDYIKFFRPPFKKQFSLGISARAELVMPIFAVNIGLGRNVIYSGKDTNCFYQIIALKASVTKSTFIHVGYQLTKFKDPNNLMLGLGYRFNAR